jgi:hypothetical protein
MSSSASKRTSSSVVPMGAGTVISLLGLASKRCSFSSSIRSVAFVLSLSRQGHGNPLQSEWSANEASLVRNSSVLICQILTEGVLRRRIAFRHFIGLLFVRSPDRQQVGVRPGENIIADERQSLVTETIPHDSPAMFFNKRTEIVCVDDFY